MISDNSIFKQKMNEIIKKEKESQENIRRIVDNYKQIAGKNTEYLKRINKIFKNDDFNESYLEDCKLLESFNNTNKQKNNTKNISLLSKTTNLLAIDRSKVRNKIKSIEKSKKLKCTVDSFHKSSNISKIPKTSSVMDNNFISSNTIPLFKEENNCISSNISLANKKENANEELKVYYNFQFDDEKYKKANETVIIESEENQHNEEEENLDSINKVDYHNLNNSIPLNDDKNYKLNYTDLNTIKIVDNCIREDLIDKETNHINEFKEINSFYHAASFDDKNQIFKEELNKLDSIENLISIEKNIDVSDNHNLIECNYSIKDNYRNEDKFNILESYTINHKDVLYYESNNNIETFNNKRTVDKEEQHIINDKNPPMNENKMNITSCSRGREYNSSRSTNYKLKNELYLIELENKNLNKKLNSLNNSINISKSKSKSKEKTIKQKENTYTKTKKEITSDIIFDSKEDDLFGNIIDQIIEGKCYIYSNRKCFSCKEILFEGKTTFFCNKMH